MSPFLIYQPPPGVQFDAHNIVTQCIENDSDSILFEAGVLPSAFFDLSRGLAGEVLHKFFVYQIRAAAVIPDLSPYSTSFQDFVRETNRGRHFRTFPTREEAVDWLTRPEGAR